MPAASWRTRPARTMSLWLIASASAGSSRSVGMSERDQRTEGLLGAGDLVGPWHAGLVDEPLDGHPTHDVGFENLREVALLHAAVPDVLRIDHHHGSVTALGEAPGLVDADGHLASCRQDAGAQRLDVLLDVALGRATLPTCAHEDVTLVLAHDLSVPPANAIGPASSKHPEQADPVQVVVHGVHHEEHEKNE